MGQRYDVRNSETGIRAVVITGLILHETNKRVILDNAWAVP